MLDWRVFANKSIILLLGSVYFCLGATCSNLAGKQAIRKIKLCFLTRSSFLKSWLWGWRVFSADGSMAVLFDSAAAACQPGKTFVRPFLNNWTPPALRAPEPVTATILGSRYLGKCCVQVWLWDTFPEWCHTGSSVQFFYVWYGVMTFHIVS